MHQDFRSQTCRGKHILLSGFLKPRKIVYSIFQEKCASYGLEKCGLQISRSFKVHNKAYFWNLENNNLNLYFIDLYRDIILSDTCHWLLSVGLRNLYSLTDDDCVCQMWRVSVSWRKTLPAPSLNVRCKSLILTTVRWTKTCGTQCAIPWNGLSGTLCAILWNGLSGKWMQVVR
jgi:hypothetical protein